MKFHATFTIRESIPLSEITSVQNRVADTIKKIMQTGKVRDSGQLMGDRTLFFVIEADTAEELVKMFAPLYDIAKPDIQPVVSFDELPKIFGELQKLKY